MKNGVWLWQYWVKWPKHNQLVLTPRTHFESLAERKQRIDRDLALNQARQAKVWQDHDIKQGLMFDDLNDLNPVDESDIRDVLDKLDQ